MHLAEVFKPYDSEIDAHEEEEIYQLLEAPLNMCRPIRNFKVKEIKDTIKNHLNPKKGPGFDLLNKKCYRNYQKKLSGQ